MSKSFRFAGVSTRNGVCKVRFANDQMRVKVLAKTGSSDIDLIELKNPMTKEDAVKYLISIDFDNGNAVVRAALEKDLAKRQPAPAKEPKVEVAKVAKAKVTKTKATPSIEGIKAKAKAKVKVAAESTESAGEDAPF